MGDLPNALSSSITLTAAIRADKVTERRINLMHKRHGGTADIRLRDPFIPSCSKRAELGSLYCPPVTRVKAVFL